MSACRSPWNRSASAVGTIPALAPETSPAKAPSNSGRSRRKSPRAGKTMIPFGCVHGWRSLFGICEKHQRYRSVQKRIEFDFVAVVREVLRSLLLADIAVAVPTVLHAAPKPPPQQIDIDVAPNGDVKTLEQA